MLPNARPDSISRPSTMKSRSFRALIVALGLCALPLSTTFAHADTKDAAGSILSPARHMAKSKPSV